MRYFVLLAVVGVLFGCPKAPMEMELPKAMKRYDDDSAFKLITADGVRVKARDVANYPKGDLEFWTDAMKTHLVARGYVFKNKRCFATKKKLDGCTLEFVVPRGAEDWMMSETIFVAGERIVLVEAAAPYARMVPLEATYAAALTTFDPRLE
jgi:hypothetical protein